MSLGWAAGGGSGTGWRTPRWMPWLAATGMFHLVTTVLATRDGLRAWTVMYRGGRFLDVDDRHLPVRSGILTSVHAFAVDPERGAFIPSPVGDGIGGAPALFALRVGIGARGQHLRISAAQRPGDQQPVAFASGLVLIEIFTGFVAAAMGTQLSVGPLFFGWHRRGRSRRWSR